MCDLIEWYYELHLTKKLQKLHIGEQSYSETCSDIVGKQFLKFRRSIEQKFSRNMDNNRQVELYLGIFPVYDRSPFAVCSTLTIVLNPPAITIKSMVLKENKPLLTKSRILRLLLCRYLNRLTSSLTEGMFSINPQTGSVEYRLNHFLSSTLLHKMLFDYELSLEIISSLKSTNRTYIQYNIIKILVLLQELEETERLKQQGVVFRKMPQEIEQKLHLIQMAVNLSQFEFQFMYNWRVQRDCNPEEQKENIKNSRQRYNTNIKMKYNDIISKEKVNNKLDSFKSMKIQQEKQYDYWANQLKKYEDTLVKSIVPAKCKAAHLSERIGTLSVIHILDQKDSKWQCRYSGGFGLIEIAEKGFIFLVQGQQLLVDNFLNTQYVYKRLLVRKKDKQSHVGKIENQKKVLSFIKNKMNPNICRFYHSFQDKYKEYLFMMHCQYSDMQNLLKNRGQTMSLLTKLYFLSQVTEGLRFLHRNTIIHRDIKPQNLLVSRDFVVKITDFGQAYHKSFANTQLMPCFTKYYVPPEYGRMKATLPQYDIYSFGVLFYLTLFDCMPIQTRDKRIELLIDSCLIGKMREYLRTVPQKSEDHGPSKIMGLLFALCMKCLREQPESRPDLHWIQIVLKQSVIYLQSLY